ncbi:MAG: hypothetical protein ACE5HJ_03845 [Thermoplasmata archaeon]
MRLRLPPALALFLLAPAVGELLSGSSPPFEYFQPLALALLAGLYGGGALILRELTLRWGKGKATLLVLGAAYGIIEEALMVKSFFDPAWPDLGILGEYGRWLGVNWVWAFFLTLYHAVFSITLPILLVELAYPDRRDTPWISRRGFGVVASVFVSVVLLGFFGLTPYIPPPSLYALFLILVILLFWIAYRLPADLGYGGKKPLPRPAFWWAFGIGGSLLFFGGLYLAPIIIPHPLIVILLSAAFILLYGDRLRRYAWRREGARPRLALAAGGLSLFILIAPLQELDASRPDNTQGMSLVGLGFALLLVLLWRRVSLSQQLEREQGPVKT